MDDMTISEALIRAYDELSRGALSGPRQEAEFLLTHILKCRRHELFLNAKRLLTPEESERLDEYIRRRLTREPSQYIVGEADFRTITLKVNKDVLIPRPETEILVEEAVREASSIKADEVIIVDLCTGSGCVAISAASEIQRAKVVATDISEAALKIAMENAQRNGVAEKVRFLAGDLFCPLEAFKGKAHLILSNPPYVSEKDRDKLEPEVLVHEPAGALFADEDGMYFQKRIIREASEYLQPGGWLMLEAGYDQSRRMREAAASSGAYEEVNFVKDYNGIERVFKARLKR